MYRNRSSNGRSKFLGVLLLCFAFASVAALTFSSRVATAAPIGPLIILGTVYDSAGNPLEGAHLVVTDLNTLVSDSTDSMSGGFYTLSIPGGGGWDIGDTIQVVATSPGEDEKTVTQVVPADAESSGMTIDVHFGTAIPQFGTTIGMAVAAGLVGVVAVVTVGVRRQ